jgi:HK97 family phage major capsid protein
MRQYANVVQGGLNYSKVVITQGSASGWVSETGSRTTMEGVKLSMIRITAGEIYAMPAVTETLLKSADFDVETMLATDIAIQFAMQEGAAFVSGDGVNKPRGICAYDFVDDAAWTWGKIGFVKSGDASGFKPLDADNGVSPVDCLMKLIYRLNPLYRANAVWGMNRDTIATVRQFKDTTGRFIWADSVVAGQPPTLLGFPVVEFPDMDAVAGGKYPIMFGDLKSAYTINDASPVNVLRDPYSTKPYVLFYTTKRVGGGVIGFDAVKFLKIAS